ncbi:MAG TPA: tetratricopeptide repeat protein [Janthinobacterium sp.]|nr:tetratricopeptide repeat protein [Janthinobacterium sp.]
MARHPLVLRLVRSSKLLTLLALLFGGLSACGGSSDVTGLMAEARSYHQKGEEKAAIIQLKNVLQRETNNAAARLLLGEVYLDTGDALSAEKELRKAQTLGVPAARLMPPLGKAMLLLGP